MTQIRSINPDRIVWCSVELGMTTEDVAASINISAATMAKVMRGSGGLSFAQLRRLANFFGKGVLFFLDAEPINENTVHTPQFRTLANQKPELSAKVRALIERVENQRAIYLALRAEIPEVDRVEFTPPKLPADNVRVAAAMCRSWLGLGRKNTFDTYRAAVESKGILVFRTNGYNGKWQIAAESPIIGFALYDDQCPVVVVKKQNGEPRQSFTLLHELAHLLLHRASSIDDEHDFQSHDGLEQEANLFAGLVLVPDDFLSEIDDHTRPPDVARYEEWLRAYTSAWGVSSEVILRRLSDSNRLDKRFYIDYRTWTQNLQLEEGGGGSRSYRHREPKHIFGDVFVRTVLGALNANQISLSKASNYLDSIKINDIHELERFYESV